MKNEAIDTLIGLIPGVEKKLSEKFNIELKEDEKLLFSGLSLLAMLIKTKAFFAKNSPLHEPEIFKENVINRIVFTLEDFAILNQIKRVELLESFEDHPLWMVLNEESLTEQDIECKHVLAVHSQVLHHSFVKLSPKIDSEFFCLLAGHAIQRLHSWAGSKVAEVTPFDTLLTVLASVENMYELESNKSDREMAHKPRQVKHPAWEDAKPNQYLH